MNVVRLKEVSFWSEKDEKRPGCSLSTDFQDLAESDESTAGSDDSTASDSSNWFDAISYYTKL